MAHSRSKPVIFLIFLLLCGCANLEAVGNFARLSADTAGYRQIVSDYSDSPERLRPYSPPGFTAQLDTLVRLRQEQKPRLENIQTVLVEYMSALGELSDGKRPCVDERIGAIGTSLGSYGFAASASGKAAATAGASIAAILLKRSLDSWRQHEVSGIIRECDPHLQAVIAGMKRLLDTQMRASLDNEEAALSKPFLAWEVDAGLHGQKESAGRVAQVLLVERRLELQKKRMRLDTYIRVLDTIGKGHADLLVNVAHIRGRLLEDRLRQYSKELMTLRISILMTSH